MSDTATATKTRPILFSSEMVQAILAGRKTMTRRIVKHQSSLEWLGSAGDDRSDPTAWGWRRDGNGRDEFVMLSRSLSQDYSARCPYGIPGDRLYVKESLACVMGNAVYTADQSLADSGWAWKLYTLPSMFMPRELSRITLEVTGVKVERLQKINDADALAEGVSATHVSGPRFEFAALWIAINGKESWDANPWVWVISFKQVEAA